MRTLRLMLPIALGMFILGVTPPASAATGDTSTTVTVTNGSLSITVPTGPVDLGSQPGAIGGETITGSLGEVQVNDERGAAAGSGWVASVVSTAFTSVSGGAIPASAISYTAGPITRVGTATYTADDPSNLSGIVPVVTATGVVGDNSATWTPTITIHVPGSAISGVYAGTITHSVA